MQRMYKWQNLSLNVTSQNTYALTHLVLSTPDRTGPYNISPSNTTHPDLNSHFSLGLKDRIALYWLHSSSFLHRQKDWACFLPPTPLTQNLKYHKDLWGEKYQHGISYGLNSTSPTETMIAEIYADSMGKGGSRGKDTLIPNLSQV